MEVVMDHPDRFHFGHGGMLEIILGVGGGLLVLVLLGLLIWRIWHKAGHRGWWGALCFVPLVNLGVLIALAFRRWPIEYQLFELRPQPTATTPPSAPPAEPPAEPPTDAEQVSPA